MIKGLPLTEYDKVIVAFSGGKDSTACVLHLLDLGIPKDRIVLWHHDVDGGPTDNRFMDWPVTRSYCLMFAKVMGFTIRMSWRAGGFLREMLRDGTATSPVSFLEDRKDGKIVTVGGNGPALTRLKFPQKGAITAGRWCSAVLKIDVARRVFANDSSFAAGKFLFVTGERAEESPNRAKYPECELHGSSNRHRTIHQWRSIHAWPEERVWEILKKWRIRPHPAYYLGWSRLSCMLCIFGDKNQWHSARELDPQAFNRVAQYEKLFEMTIDRDYSVEEMADLGTSFVPDADGYKKVALRTICPSSYLRVRKGLPWRMPKGAFKKAGGPT